MRYYKTIVDNYITSIGTGGGGTEITETEYNTILSVIQQKPARTATTDYRLIDGELTWEQYERIDPEPEPEIPENLTETAEYLLNNGMVELPEPEEEPDYLNEHEEEPNYFNEEGNE